MSSEMNNSQRFNLSSGTYWEEVVGYSRLVKVGNLIEVAGTASVDSEGNIIGKGSFYEQTKFILQKIENALKQANASIKNVVRTRIYVTDITKWQDVGKAHGEFFRDIKPVTSIVEVQNLIHPDLWVEIEVTAVLY
ncbi:MAG: RidA family protein [Bacteroidia bacterium]|nr:RidA family protein [Bacteroidia bacterium]MDW8345570.1 RidA family protein [Bacteroidia bacterium]